jgi:hypothetical protein
MVCIFSLTIGQNSVAQKNDQELTYEKAHIQKEKPTVYLAFEYMGNRQPLFSGESSQGVWLKLHNNSIWSIYYAGFSLGEASLSRDNKAQKEVGVLYDVKIVGKNYKKNLPPIGTGRRHTSSIIKISPGNSILFSVPREHLANGLAICVNFNFAWEVDRGMPKSAEPTHQACFSSYALPKLQNKR